MSGKCNSSRTDEPILMKLYTVVVYNLKMGMKGDNPDPTYLMGNVNSAGQGYPVVI